MSHPSSTFVHFGGCWNGDHDVPLDCAVDPTHCPATPTDHSKAPVNNFHSVALLAATEYAGSDKHDECKAENVQNVAKQCPGARGLCQVGAVDGGECAGSTTEGCNLMGSGNTSGGSNGSDESTTTSLATVYGACQNSKTREIACAWSADSCNDDEIFLSPAELFAVLVEGSVHTDRLYCDCSQVRVGACAASEAYGHFCAVQASSCGSEERFKGVRELDQGEECRLCDALPDQVRLETDFYFVQRRAELLDALAQGRSKTNVLLSDEHPSNRNKTAGDTRSTGFTVTAVIGVVGMLLGLFGVAAVVRGRRRRQRRTIAEVEAIHKDDELFMEVTSGRYTDERDDLEEDIPAANKTMD